jgi:hypothetical protein
MALQHNLSLKIHEQIKETKHIGENALNTHL